MIDIRYIYIIIIALLGFAFVIKEKNLVCPATIFNFLWVFVLLCAVENDLVTTADTNTYTLFFCGVMSFDLGCFVASNFKFKRIRFGSRRINVSDGQYSLKTKIVYLLIAICTLYYFLNFLQVINQVSSFNFSNIMQTVNTEDTLTKQYGIINMLYTLVINPFSYISPFIVATDYWQGKRDRKIFYATLTMLLLRLFSSGNRLSFIFIFIYMIIIGLLTNKMKSNKIKQIISKKENRHQCFLIFGLICVALVVFIYSTISRGYDVKSNVFINFAIPPRMFEIWSEKVQNSGSYGLGFASLQGIIYPIFYILKNSIGLPIPQHILDVYNVTTSTATNWVSGGTYMHNAYVSIFWYFYYDFRIFGVLVLSFILGLFSQKSYLKAVFRSNIKSVAIYCAYLRIIIGSYSGMAYSNIAFGVGMILITFILYRKEKVRDS